MAEKMTVKRAIEILDPAHREHYESIEPVNEACRMGMEALKNPLLALIKEEVPFRLSEVIGVSEDKQTFELIEEIVDRLYDENNVMFDYDALDSFIIGILDERGVSHGAEEEQKYGQ